MSHRRRWWRLARWVVLFTALSFALCEWQAGRVLHRGGSRKQAWIWGWDTNGYMAWAHSLAVDGDLDVRNQFEFVAHLRGFGPTQQSYASFMANPPLSEKGLVADSYAFGSALLSMPFMLTARALCAWHARRTGHPVSRFASIYPLAFNLSNTLWTVAGLALAAAWLRRRHGSRRALIAVFAVLLGSPLFHYLIFETEMSHNIGFFSVTLFLVLCERWFRAVRRALEGEAGSATGAVFVPACAMGVAAGLAALTRYDHAAIAFVPFGLVCLLVWQRPRQWRRIASVGLLSLGGAAPMTLVGFFPQMMVWKTVFGHWIYRSYGSVIWSPIPAHGLQILFSLRNGLFVWTPLAVLSVLGIALALARPSSRGGAAAALLALLGGWWIYSGWQAWELGDALGMRGFVDYSYPLMAGLAWLLGVTVRRCDAIGRWGVHALIALCVFWNIHLTVAYWAVVQPHAGPLNVAAIFSRWDIYPPMGDHILRNFSGRRFTLYTPADADVYLDGNGPAR